MISTPLRWGILATGHIAGAFATGLKYSRSGYLAAVGSRSVESARRFGDEHGLAHDACHGSYEALLDDARIDAIYISNPHPGHAEWAVRAAQAGKHILCEKPLAMNFAEAALVVDAARNHGVFLMEAFMYRCHPQTQRLAEMIREGVIGRVRSIQATFSFRGTDHPASRLLDPALGGGGILDVGCYPVSMTRYLAGAAGGQAFSEPRQFHACGHLGATGVDEYAAAVASFPGEIVAQLACGVRVSQENVVRVYGEEGSLFIPAPWAPTRDGGRSVIYLRSPNTAEPKEAFVFEVPAQPAFLYTQEAEHVAACLPALQSPAMNWDDSLGNMRMLDQWRSAIGLSCPAERTQGTISVPMPESVKISSNRE